MKKLLFCFISILGISSMVFAQNDNKLTSKEKKKGWTLLFDGVSTQGWTTTRDQPVPASGGGWEVANGCISTVMGGKGGDIITIGEYSDFELSVDYKITPGCNSGIKYFFTSYETGGSLGCEYQVLDDALAADNKLANHLCGSLYDVLPPVEAKKKVNPAEEWNTIRVIVDGKNVKHFMNGILILEYIRGDKAYLDAVAKSKFSKAVPSFGMVEKGHILLQYHGGLVAFKNVKIRVL